MNQKMIYERKVDVSKNSSFFLEWKYFFSNETVYYKLKIWLWWDSSPGAMANVLGCDLEVSEFKLHSHYDVHFGINTEKKHMKPLIHLVMG